VGWRTATSGTWQVWQATETDMLVDAVVGVWAGGMAVGAGDLVFQVHADRDGPPAHLVIFSRVAVDAVELQAAHVHVYGAGRVEQGLVQVAMLDGVTAAAVEMAGAAVLPGWQAHAAGSCRARSTPSLGRPLLPFVYCPDWSWQTRQSTFSWIEKSKSASLSSHTRHGRRCRKTSWIGCRCRSC
jgi:hypothetical protein